MFDVKTAAIAGGTLVLAAGAGLYMQAAPAAPVHATAPAPVPAPVDDMPMPAEAMAEHVLATLPDEAEAPADLDETPVELAAITLTSSDVTDLPVTMTADAFPATPTLAAVTSDDLMQPDPEPQPEPAAEPDCTVDLTGESRAAAMVALTLSAPCQPNARVLFKHAGMNFTAATDDTGSVTVEVPALAEDATFIAMLDDGNGAAVEMTVDSLFFYDRAIVQWRGDAGIGIHALEFGAAYDDAGHVWSGAPRDATVAARGEGGFVVRLGDTEIDGASMVDVYTFPTATTKLSGDVDLSVEVEVTDLNCGRDVSAEVLKVSQGMASPVTKLAMTMPDCDAVGDYLLLNNLVDDLKIASR
jgi:hypothetical protein